MNPLFTQALTALNEQRFDDAGLTLEALLAENPDHIGGLCNLGHLRYLQGRTQEAETLLQKGLTLDSTHADLNNNFALIKQQSGKLEEAEQHYMQACQSNPKNANFLANLAGIQRLRGALNDATLNAQKALALAPNNADALNCLAMLRLDVADTASAERLFGQAFQQQPTRPEFRNNQLMAHLYRVDSHSKSYRELFSASESPTSNATTSDKDQLNRIKNSADSELVIGFLSADFYQHPVGSILERALPAISERVKRCVLYDSGTQDDAVTESLAAVADMKQVSSLNDQQLASLIVSDHVDVLIDLSGPTAGGRGRVFQHRSAPVQLTWLGFPGPSGNPDSDATLMSAELLGAYGHRYFPEPVLPIHAPPFLMPVLSELPCEPSTAVSDTRAPTFASFANAAKINQQCIALWSGVLKANPASRLIIKNRFASDVAFQRYLSELFQSYGVSKSQLEYRGQSEYTQMLGEYSEVDIVLDTWPFTGGMTTLESLWMGVPVLTMAGERPVSRQGSAINRALDLNDWIVRTPAEFVTKATDFLNEPSALKHLRENLRERVRASSLFDSPAFAKALLEAIRLMPDSK